MSVKILIVEDHDDFRKTVRAHLERQDFRWEVTEAASGELGVSLALREQPHIILMDIRLPGMNGIDAANKIKVHIPESDIVLLTMFETEAFKKVFQSENVTAYVGKSELYEKLVPIIKEILASKKISI